MQAHIASGASHRAGTTLPAVGYGGAVGAHGDHAQRLYAVAEALVSALTPEDVAQAVFERALSDLGARTVGFWLLRGGVVRFAGGVGHVDDSLYQLGEFPLDADLPGAIAVRTGDVVAYGSHEERDSKWPRLARIGQSAEALAVVPMIVEGRALGCLHIGYTPTMAVSDMDLTLLKQLAALCAAALNRSELFEEEREEREQLEFFSDATRALIRSLDPGEVIESLVDIAVPRLAPWCAVLSPRDNELRTVAVRIAGDDGNKTRAVKREVFPLSGDFHVSRCFRTGRMQVTEVIPDYVTSARHVRQETARAVLETGLAGGIILPIPWGGSPIGVLVLGYTDPANVRSPRLRETAEGLALRAGVALHNATRYDAERTVARTLTEALLPPTVQEIPGYEVAVRYLPASGDVAGDWYDLFAISGKFVLGVGDSAGHGIPAATVMAELRNAARGLAAAGLSPVDILDNLTVVANYERQEMFATAVYGVLDPQRNVLDWALAGHPPPIMVRDGRARLLDQDAGRSVFGTPIASGIRGERSEHRIALAEGDVVVFYTDGVVERRSAPIEQGLGLLLRMTEEMSEQPVEAVAERMIGELCSDAADDCCVMIIRRRA